MKTTERYEDVIMSYDQGQRGAGWSLVLVDAEGDGFGVNLNYHKLGMPSKQLYQQSMSVADLIRLKAFCEQAIAALTPHNLTPTPKGG